MLLAVDAGNTHTVFGLFEGLDLADTWRIATDAERTSDEHALLLDGFLRQRSRALGAITGAVVSSTVPRLTPVFREMAGRYLHVAPLVLEPGVRTGMPILYDNPKQVGPDRIANAVAAFERYGGPTIVVDFGTATTVDVTSANGEYLGGAILPGIEVSLDALMEKAAALFWVEMARPRRVIGKSTTESVQSGVLYGFAAAVDGLVRRFEGELGACNVVSTGGLGELVAPLSERIQNHDPWLTLAGLRMVYERNQ